MADIPAGYDPMGPTAEGLLDNKGTPFNPSIHQAYKGGRAFLTRMGEWVKKGGRPKTDAPPVSTPEKGAEKAVETGAKGFDPNLHFKERKPVAAVAEKAADGASLPSEASDPVASAAIPSAAPAVDPGASGQNPQLEASSRAAVVFAESLLVLTLGASQGHTKEEREARLNEWKLFLADKPGFALPPWAVLIGGYGMQVAARSDKSDFQKRCAMWGAKFKKWFGRG